MTQHRRVILPNPHALWLHEIERWGARVLGVELGAQAWMDRWRKWREENRKHVR